MAGTDAQRARRYRRHKAGDHSLCTPGRCPALTAPSVVMIAAESAEQGRVLGRSGAELWDRIMADQTPGPVQAVLLLEACRITDRLDALDRQLRGEDWLRFRHDGSGVEVTVYVDKVLAEAREQAVALKTILAELRQSLGQDKQQEPAKGGGVLADLAAKRAARSQDTAG
ncbi:MAG: hypothetical protein ACRDMV_13265 [Streptosporangiales bacterium]